MWKLHRYYLKELSASAALTFVVLFGVVLLSTVNRGLDRAQGFGLIAATRVMMFWAVDTLPHLMSMSLLFATVLAYARASQDREITAIRSAGLSPRVAMAPALLVGIAFSLVGGWAQHYMIPWVHYEKYHVITEELRNVMVNTGWTDDKLQFKDKFVMTWDHQDENRDWHNVYLKVGENADISLGSGIYHARKASLSIQREKDEIELRLFDLRQPGDMSAEPTHFNMFAVNVNLRSISEQSRRTESDKDLSSDHLLAEVDRGQHDNPNGARYTVHRRSCFSLMPFLFAPIGFCIGVLARDRGRVLALVFAMVPLGIFYICDAIGAKLVRVIDWPPVGWLPAAVITLIGAPFCWRLLRL